MGGIILGHCLLLMRFICPRSVVLGQRFGRLDQIIGRRREKSILLKACIRRLRIRLVFVSFAPTPLTRSTHPSSFYLRSQMSIHTAPGCTMPSNYGASATLTSSTNCDAVATNDAGCGLRSSQANNYGQPYNNNGGGVHISCVDFFRLEFSFQLTSLNIEPNQ